MRRTWRLLSFTLLWTGVVAWTYPTQPMADTADSTRECPPLSAPPWLALSQPVDGDAIPGLDKFFDSERNAYSDERLSGTWFSEESGSLALVIGIVNPTAADLHTLANRADSAGLTTIQVVVQPVPLGQSDLSAIQAKVDTLLSGAGFEFTSSARPDAGVVEVGVYGDVIEGRSVLVDGAEPCQISIYRMGDEDRYRAMDGRANVLSRRSPSMALRAQDTSHNCARRRLQRLSGWTNGGSRTGQLGLPATIGAPLFGLS
jgi:hypothetical protein